MNRKSLAKETAAPLQIAVFCPLGIISSCPYYLITRNQGGKKKQNLLRHTGTKVRGGAAQAKSVNMKNQTKQRWNNVPLEEKSNNE